MIVRLAPLLLAGLLVGCGSGTRESAPPTTAPAATGPRPIEVESPAAGSSVTSPFHVSGTASVYEATLVVELRRGGTLLARRTITASEGAPGRGTFDGVFSATPGALTIVAYAPSAANGEPQHTVRVPVEVTP